MTFTVPVDRHDLHSLMVPGCPSCDARYERLHGRSES